jgi:O-antigen/teichoic acid export membrane protein
MSADPMDMSIPVEPAGQHSAALAKLARGGSINVVGAAVNGALSILLVLVVTRGYSPAQAGAFFAATSMFLILSAVVELGVDTGLIRWLPRYLVERRHADIRTALRVALGPVVIASVVTAGVVVAAAPWFAGLIAAPGQHHTATSGLRLLALFLPIAAASDLTLAATQGYGTMRPAVLVDKIGRSVVQIAAVVAATFAGAAMLGLVVSWAAPYLLSAATGLWLLYRMVHRRQAHDAAEPGAQPTGLATRAIAAEFWQYTGPRAVSRITQVALQRSDIILVAALRGPKDAAVYTAATRFLVVGQLGTTAIQQALAPNMSRLLAMGDPAGVTRIFRTSTAWLMILAWPIYLTCATFGPLLLRIFGHTYAAGGATVLILSLTMLLATAAGPTDVALLMAGRSGLSLFNNLAALVVDVGLNLVLIPHLGVTGAAISWAVAISIRNILPLLQVRSMLHMTPFGPGSAWVAVSAAACFGVLPVLARTGPGLSVPVMVVALAVATPLYAYALWRGRVVLDLAAFSALFRSTRTSGQPRPETDPAIAS